VADLFRGKFSWKAANPNRRMLVLLAASLLPMAVSFLLLDLFNAVSADQDIIVEGVCFLFTSFLLFVSDRVVAGHKTAKDMSFRDALAVGAMQAVAPMPGISRSGSTIATGLFMGLDRKFAVSFSFIMGVPTVLGANLLELRDVAAEGLRFPLPVLLAGMAAALVFGLAAIKMVNWLVTSNKFKYFAWYTLILGLVTIGIGVCSMIAS
jgi:undecaprenyl-diphosphatase